MGKKKVLMTGFCPFAGYETNPSWEGVKSINERRVAKKYGYFLLQKEIGVNYKAVDKIIPFLWDVYLPVLTIHVGVSPKVTCFVLETQANRSGYDKEDAGGYYHKSGINVCQGHSTIVTQLDVAAICRKFNSHRNDKLEAKISSDAGRYLCEYVYYASLCYGRSPTLFVHVPLDKYTTIQLAQGLKCILKLCLKQLA